MTTMPKTFAQAAKRHGVPESVLLAVSYMESRWDCNGGRLSTAAGFGPMHLTDGAGPSRSRHHHLDGYEDPRGDDSRSPHFPIEPEERQNGSPTSLHTLERAAELTGESLEHLRKDPAANIRRRRGAARRLPAGRWAPRRASDPADWYGAVARYCGRRQPRTIAAELRRRGVRDHPRRRRPERPTTGAAGDAAALSRGAPVPRPGWTRLGLPPPDRRRRRGVPRLTSPASGSRRPTRSTAGAGNYGNHSKARQATSHTGDRLHRRPRHRGEGTRRPSIWSPGSQSTCRDGTTRSGHPTDMWHNMCATRTPPGTPVTGTSIPSRSDWSTRAS